MLRAHNHRTKPPNPQFNNYLSENDSKVLKIFDNYYIFARINKGLKKPSREHH